MSRWAICRRSYSPTFRRIWCTRITRRTARSPSSTARPTQVLRTRSVPFGFTAAAELGLSKFLYVTDTAADQVHVIDLTSLIKLTDISVPAPSSITVNPRTKQAYVTSGNTGIAVIDTNTNTVLHTFTITNTNIGPVSIDPGDRSSLCRHQPGWHFQHLDLGVEPGQRDGAGDFAGAGNGQLRACLDRYAQGCCHRRQDHRAGCPQPHLY